MSRDVSLNVQEYIDFEYRRDFGRGSIPSSFLTATFRTFSLLHKATIFTIGILLDSSSRDCREV